MHEYKLGILLDVLEDFGVVEEAIFDMLKTHEITNYLKNILKVDTYLPARESMGIFQKAVRLMVVDGEW